ncbi:MAG TPA: hypothetical protein EYN54_03415, partial [Methylococcaceae bacterium]|nr:hypothetical protein [Methylococcaceae bacterium]
KKNLQRFNNLSVWHIHAEGVDLLMKRSMQLQCTIQEGTLYLSDETYDIPITLGKF